MPEPIVTFNEETLKSDLRELVRRTVEDTLNGLLEEEAGDLVGAERYERTAEREAYRAGHYERKLTTTSGEVTVRITAEDGKVYTGRGADNDIIVSSAKAYVNAINRMIQTARSRGGK